MVSNTRNTRNGEGLTRILAERIPPPSTAEPLSAFHKAIDDE